MKAGKDKERGQREIVEPSAMPRVGNLPLRMDRELLIQGLIISEILDKPKAKRKRR